jgi:hypothetical protein
VLQTERLIEEFTRKRVSSGITHSNRQAVPFVTAAAFLFPADMERRSIRSRQRYSASALDGQSRNWQFRTAHSEIRCFTRSHSKTEASSDPWTSSRPPRQSGYSGEQRLSLPASSPRYDGPSLFEFRITPAAPPISSSARFSRSRQRFDVQTSARICPKPSAPERARHIESTGIAQARWSLVHRSRTR